MGGWQPLRGSYKYRAAYVAKAHNVMDFLQLIFAFINAPLLPSSYREWKGHRPVRLWSAERHIAASVHHILQHLMRILIKGGGWSVELKCAENYPSEMAQNFWTAIFAFSVCFIVIIIISLLTK
jgi:SSS family solute:Na+ symporter